MRPLPNACWAWPNEIFKSFKARAALPAIFSLSSWIFWLALFSDCKKSNFRAHTASQQDQKEQQMKSTLPSIKPSQHLNTTNTNKPCSLDKRAAAK